MRFFNPFRKDKQPLQKSADVLGTRINNEMLRVFKHGFSTRVSPAEAYHLYNKNPTLSDAVDMIATKFAGLTPIIKKGSKEIIPEGQALDFLKKPNKLEDYNEFATTLSTNYLLNNNAFIEAIGFIKAKPKELYNVRNSFLSITEQNSAATYLITAVDFFAFLSGNFILDANVGRIIEPSKLQELYHMKGFSLSSGSLLSVSRVMSLQKELGIIDESSIRNLSILKKGFHASGVLSVDTDDQDAFEQLVKDVNARFSGAGNAGSILTSKGKDIDYKSFDMTNRDLQGLENKKESKSTVYSRYDIPGPLIDNSAQTYDNYQTALYALYDNAVFPLADKIFGMLTRIFQQRKMLKPNEVITYDIGAISTLQLRRFEEIKSAKDSGVLTIDELRAKAGYEELGSGGDEVLVPINLVPVGKDIFTTDNLTEPKQKFISLMKKNGLADHEIDGFWNEYKARINKD